MRTIAIASGLLLLAQTSSAAVLHVPADYPTISLALAAASPGDEILVAAGTYPETFTGGASKDGVKIHSESGPAATLIDGGNTGTVVTFNGVGSGTELVGFTITNGPGGIQVTNASPKIDNDIVTACRSFGDINVTSGSPSITHCLVQGNLAPPPDPFGETPPAAIHVFDGASATITDNTVSNNQVEGVFVEAPTYVDFENNVVQGNQGGGLLWQGALSGIVMPGVVKGNSFLSNAGGGMAVWFLAGIPTPSAPQIEGNVFQSNSGNGLVIGDTPSGLVQNNQSLGNSASGLYIYGSHITVHGNLIQDNQGGGISLWHANATIENNLILRNQNGGAQGGGVLARASTSLLTSNTLALNSANLGGGNIAFREGSALTLQRNIVSHSPNQGLLQDNSAGANTITMSCNDVANNTGGNFAGMPDPTGSNGNISLDPLYCDLSALDVHLASTSPCTAANSPAGCGLVGALDVGCDGPVRTEVTTWGGLKARYR